MSRMHSSLARLQQCILLFLLAVGALWLLWLWPRSSVVALLGCIAILAVHAWVLAIEFALLPWVGRDSSTPSSSVRVLLRAWLAEAWVAALVFGWRQPFRWRAEPDQLEEIGASEGRRGVVFIHGFVCNRGFWLPWCRRVRAEGRVFIALNLQPIFGSIDNYIPQIEKAVQHVRAVTGLAPLIVCHSMGGLAVRAWLHAHQPADVHHIVTIASPHGGTWLARFSHLPNGRQMRIGSLWLTQLAAHTRMYEARFTCWYSNADNVVFPPTMATLPAANNRLVAGKGHVELAFTSEVMDETLTLFLDS